MLRLFALLVLGALCAAPAQSKTITKGFGGWSMECQNEIVLHTCHAFFTAKVERADTWLTVFARVDAQKKWRVMLMWLRFDRNDEEAAVSVAFDDESPRKLELWKGIGLYIADWYPTGAEARKLLTAERMRVKYRLADDTDIEHSIPLVRLREVMQELGVEVDQ